MAQREKKKSVLRATAFTTVVCGLLGSAFAQVHPIPASKCSLPVDSTIVLEYPLGSGQKNVTLNSDPNNVPTVETSKQKSDQTMDTKFTKLNQSGTIDGQPIASNLSPNVPSKGSVTNVTQSTPGAMAHGHHTFNLFLEYTVNPGASNGVTFYNKQPIKVEADIDSTSPSGRTYTMTNGPIDLFDKNNKSKTVARLISLENRVHQ